MDSSIKSGNEVLDQFFKEVENIEGLDRETLKTVTSLHNEGKLTVRNITNELLNIRESCKDGQD